MAILTSETHPLKDESITIRSARASDAEQLLQLVKVILTEDVHNLLTPEELTPTIAEEVIWIERENANPGNLILIAEANGILVGMLDFQSGSRKRIAHRGAFGLSVAKSHRGKGIATVLLKTLIHWSKSHPILENIQLKVHAKNESAIHIYEKLGFQREGLIKKDPKYGDDEYSDTVLMSLDLDNI